MYVVSLAYSGRPQDVGAAPETRFLLKRVLPGGQLAHLSDVAGEMERAGFRILDIRSVREHYARTCREWVARLATNRDTCIPLVGERTYRTWLLHLAGSACSFETGGTEAFSVLAVKFLAPGPGCGHSLAPSTAELISESSRRVSSPAETRR